MLNSKLIIAIMIRYFYGWRHNLDRLSDSFYWPAMELLLWGLTTAYLKSVSPNFPQVVPVLLTGLIFWMITWRGQYEININLLHEIWDKNLVNMFSSPLRIREWIIAVMALGIFKMLLTLAFAGLIAYVLFSFNIFIYGFLILPFFASLLIAGWAAGFVVAGFIIRYGHTIQTLAWSGVFLLAPFSALYYPVSLLPNWAQLVAKFVPPSYIFEGMREVLFTGHLSYDKLIISLALDGIYLVLSILFFVFMFNQSRKLGLGRLI